MRLAWVRGVVALVVVGLLVVSPSPAHAYIDPGAGSMTLQLLLGGVAGLLALFKAYWQRLRHRKKPGRAEDHPSS